MTRNQAFLSAPREFRCHQPGSRRAKRATTTPFGFLPSSAPIRTILTYRPRNSLRFIKHRPFGGSPRTAWTHRPTTLTPPIPQPAREWRETRLTAPRRLLVPSCGAPSDHLRPKIGQPHPALSLLVRPTALLTTIPHFFFSLCVTLCMDDYSRWCPLFGDGSVRRAPLSRATLCLTQMA